MRIDPETLSSNAVYRLLTSVVVPRPIALVSSVDAQGVFNVAPFSYFNILASRPPLLGISIGPRHGEPKHTLLNIQATGDFVINVVDEALSARAVVTSGDWPAGVDEFRIAGLVPVPSERVKSPRVEESPVSMECRLDRVIEVGTSWLVVGEMVRMHVRDSVLTDGHVDIGKLHPVGRLGGEGYAPVRDTLQIPRPRVTPPA